VGILLVAMPTSTYAQIAQSKPAPEFVLDSSVLRRAVADLQPAAQPPCDDSRAKGRLDAASLHSSTGWFIGGIGSGVLLGLIGTAIITGAAALGNPQPKQTPTGMQTDCYREGYSSKAKNKNTISALLGGAIGAVVWTVLYVATREGGYYYYREPMRPAPAR
jgi:hypothetical protein